MIFHDLKEDRTRHLDSHGTSVQAVALDPKGEIAVTGDLHGIVRVGPATGEEPHLLLGHEGDIWDIEVSPDGRWIASASQDRTVRLWPMPDLDEPPFHTLPYEEFLARLRALTNLRAVKDDQSASGYRIEPGPFPGWETVPTW